ncbi:MAG: histone deacetylase [Planctomycetota bacterium]
MHASYHDDYVIPLPPKHSFPMPKFKALRDLLVREGVIDERKILEPEECSWADLALVHTTDYLGALAAGTLGERAEKRMGLPWSPALVRRSRLAVTGTINATECALRDGVAGNLAGGTHHAMPDHGQGFCVLNDVGVALRLLLAKRAIRRALVFDLDVHQGNGTAAIFEGDDRVFTCSVHGAKNFPLRKEASDLDVPVEDGLTDGPYLDVVRDTFERAIGASRPDLIVYLGGVDVLHDDKFGRLALTLDGLRAREAYVTETVRELGVPLCLLLSGGYAPTPAMTAERHAEMYRAASRAYAPAQPNRPAT